MMFHVVFRGFICYLAKNDATRLSTDQTKGKKMHLYGTTLLSSVAHSSGCTAAHPSEILVLCLIIFYKALFPVCQPMMECWSHYQDKNILAKR